MSRKQPTQQQQDAGYWLTKRPLFPARMLSEDFFRRRLEVALADYLEGYSLRVICDEVAWPSLRSRRCMAVVADDL